MIKKERNLNLDIMRLLGVLIIMIAHSSPPEWLFQLRNFGTPLLIVASALTYSVIYKNKSINVISFYKKRLMRLILPAWIFLSFFFILFFIISSIFKIPYPFEFKNVIFSYFFLNGIGFVWIFKVYIILALVTPLTLLINRRLKNINIYFFLLLVSYAAYEIMVYLISPNIHGFIASIFNQVIFIVIPYTILYFYGYRLSSLTNKQILCVSVFAFCIFITLMLIKYHDEGHFVPTQLFKYPPTLYYLSYAIFSVNILYVFCRSLVIENSSVKRIITWLSSNSLWIYLWHILAFYCWSFIIGDPDGEFFLFITETVFLLSFGIICTLVQKYLISRLNHTNQSIEGKFISLLS